MRKLSLTLALLLLAAFLLPYAAKASGNDLPPQLTTSAPNMTPATPGCKANLQKGTPEPVFLSSGNCGSCSDSLCQGTAIGNACTRGGLGYTCQPAYGNNCSTQPDLWQCVCWPPGVPFP